MNLQYANNKTNCLRNVKKMRGKASIQLMLKLTSLRKNEINPIFFG